jgi:hypothetical protein
MERRTDLDNEPFSRRINRSMNQPSRETDNRNTTLGLPPERLTKRPRR